MAFTTGDVLTGHYFMVSNAKDMGWAVIGNLTDADNGEVSFKFGQGTIQFEDDLRPGDIVSVTGTVGTYADKPQVVSTSVCLVENPNDAIIRCVLPTAPIDVEEAWQYMEDCIAVMRHDGLKSVTSGLLAEHSEILKRIPAGKAMHHAYIGGWVEHTSSIVRAALAIRGAYNGRLDYDLLVAGAVLHDIGKVLEFKRTKYNMVDEYSFLGDGVGHATLGVGMIMSFAQSNDFDISEVKLSALLNIVGTHAGQRDWGACADPVCREAMVISHLDNLDAHMNSMSAAIKDVGVGEHVYNRAVGRSVYKVAP